VIVLDTNVVSELMRDVPDTRVTEWVKTQPSDALWLTALTVMEIHNGLHQRPDGITRKGLTERYEQLASRTFGSRVLPFDEVAAKKSAELLHRQRRSGYSLSLIDSLIAGSALAQNALLATRDRRLLNALGAGALNPWDTSLEA